MINRIGNSIFYIGLIIFTLAVLVGMPLAVPIGGLSLILVLVGGWLWLKPVSVPHTPSDIPLSQQPAKYKIFAGIPAVIAILLSFFIDAQKEIIGGLGLFLLGYALVGVLELKLDKRFPSAKSNWENLVWWKKLIISTAVICVATFAAVASIPFFAKIIYD